MTIVVSIFVDDYGYEWLNSSQSDSDLGSGTANQVNCFIHALKYTTNFR